MGQVSIINVVCRCLVSFHNITFIVLDRSKIGLIRLLMSMTLVPTIQPGPIGSSITQTPLPMNITYCSHIVVLVQLEPLTC